MTKKHIYFRPTTAQQRRLLFETWETTGDVKTACRQAHVCPATFYYWKPRFEAGGYAALEKAASHAPNAPHKTSAEIEQQVIALRQEHPSWGKERIADELAKANNWERVISPNTVRRILVAAGDWSQPPTTPPKKVGESRSSARRRRPVRR
jgi:transposase